MKQTQKSQSQKRSMDAQKETSVSKMMSEIDLQRNRAGSVASKDKAVSQAGSSSIALNLMRSATSEGILKQRTGEGHQSASRKSTSNVEFGNATTKVPASQATKGARTETPKTFLGSATESGNLGAGLNRGAKGSSQMASALGLASQPSLGASSKQKLEARKGESGTPRVSLMEVYKDFLK